MKKIILTSIVTLLASSATFSQAIWDRAHLEQVKTQLDCPMYSQAYDALIADANRLLDAAPLSVMDKQLPAPSGDNHDYTSLARYYHPDPSKADGLPYINRDGITNPEINLYDRNTLGTTAKRISTLALAYFFNGDERYAAKAGDFLKTWFLNKDTRMNPHFEYAQITPGSRNNKGRCYGVLDGYSFVEMLDGVALLQGSKSWTKKNDKQLRQWFDKLLTWILTSDFGVEESRQANNHSTAYDAQAIALAMYCGRNDVAKRIIAEFPERRIFTQIEPDGTQPHEMWRTLSFGYSQYNLTHFIDIFLMAQKLGIKIDNSTDADGRNFYKALDLLASYLGKPVETWPGKQISDWDGKQQEVARDLWRVATFIDTTRTDYKEAYQTHRIFRPADRFTLLYYTPDGVDNAFAAAAHSLEYTAKQATEERKKEHNAARHRVSPRTVDAEGNLVLVHPHDWTSGFFAGELWMMYEFTNDTRWREKAVSFTWLIEEAKWHRGTHDLGFMMGDSFGKAWELTGEKSYFDVVRQSSETLLTRFNTTIGAIRSWDHNAEVWKFPVIIDNMMNLEMLFKMYEATGNRRYRDVAISHADITLKNHFRPDYSSYHVVDYDAATGDVRMRVTAQGFSDDSFWSRGQAWGLHGYTSCYRYTRNQHYLECAQGIADWFLALPNMPSDLIPYWDMKALGTDIADNPAVPRDASAAAIFASGLFELALYVDEDSATRYRTSANTILDNLRAGYTLRPEEKQGFILNHSTGHHPGGSEIDVPIVYADYFYLEALLRSRNIAKYLHK